MRRVVLTLEYHGKGFYGWQRQGPDRSVQAVVEQAVADLVRHPVSVQAAGRTDRGVHARAMPAHVDVDSRLTPRELLMAINARLPGDVSVQAVQEADPRFHARFDALSKLYRYTFLRARARSPLLQDRAHLLPRPVNLAAMRDAATRLVGTHDFVAFQTNPDELEPGPGNGAPHTVDTIGPAAVKHADFTPPPWRTAKPVGTVRTLSRFELIERGPLLRLEVEGNGFLRGMVRALAGSLLEVGLGKQPPEWMDKLLAARDRKQAGANLPPHGLTLISVSYPAEPFAARPAYFSRL
jgi:tRNA pseudouridine38-40 synthase